MGAVSAIDDMGIIRAMAAELRTGSERNYVLFMTGLYLGRRISDILPLRVRDVRDREYIRFREGKTGKHIDIYVHPELREIFAGYCRGRDPGEYLFRRQRENEPIGRTQAWRILNRAAQAVGYTKPVGCHSMRKSVAREMRRHGVDLMVIMAFLNHSDEQYTKRYLGITQEEMDAALSGVSFV